MAMVIETYTPEQLMASDYPIESVAGVAGEILTKNTPVEQNATTFKWHVATTNAKGVVTVDTALNGACTVIVSGTFNFDALNWSATLTTDAAKQYSLKAPCFAKKLV